MVVVVDVTVVVDVELVERVVDVVIVVVVVVDVTIVVLLALVTRPSTFNSAMEVHARPSISLSARRRTNRPILAVLLICLTSVSLEKLPVAVGVLQVSPSVLT